MRLWELDSYRGASASRPWASRSFGYLGPSLSSFHCSLLSLGVWNIQSRYLGSQVRQEAPRAKLSSLLHDIESPNNQYSSRASLPGLESFSELCSP